MAEEVIFIISLLFPFHSLRKRFFFLCFTPSFGSSFRQPFIMWNTIEQRAQRDKVFSGVWIFVTIVNVMKIVPVAKGNTVRVDTPRWQSVRCVCASEKYITRWQLLLSSVTVQICVGRHHSPAPSFSNYLPVQFAPPIRGCLQSESIFQKYEVAKRLALNSLRPWTSFCFGFPSATSETIE